MCMFPDLVKQCRTLLSTACFLLIGFFLHRYLIHVYYDHCNGNIVQILFFRNSHFCVTLRSIIDILEGNYFKVFKALVSFANTDI